MGHYQSTTARQTQLTRLIVRQALGRREMREIAPRIVVDEAVRLGRPVLRGMRVPVDLVVGRLAGGVSMEAVTAEYCLEREDVLTALAHAAQVLGDERVRAVS